MTTTKEENMLENLASVLTPKLLEKIKQKGLPTSKWESWRYSSLPSFAPTHALTASSVRDSQAEDEALLQKFPHRLVFSAGHWCEELSRLPAGVVITEALTHGEQEDFISLLGHASAPKNYRLEIQKDIALASPLALIELAPTDAKNSCQFESTSLEVNVGAGAKLEMIHLSLLRHDSEIEEVKTSELWRNHALSLTISENANVNYIKLTSSNESTLSLSSFNADVRAHASLSTTVVTLGGKLTRQEVNINLIEESAHGEIRSLAALRKQEQADLSAFIYHKVPRTTSNQLVKNILDDKSRGVFTGKIYIEREAIEVDSAQLSRALLLSKKAQMNARPQLEIYADDVKASHGATIGQLSEEELFYLQSRGLTSEKARQMLCHGFGLEVTQEIKSLAAKEIIEQALFEGFERYSIAAAGEQS